MRLQNYFNAPHSTMTQRQITLWLMVLMMTGALLVALGLFLTSSHPIEVFLSTCAIFVFAGLLWLYWRGWEPARYVLVLINILLAALVTQEPYVSEKFSVVVFVPPVLALILASPTWVITSAIIIMVTLIVRAGGQGIYVEPVNLALYTITIGTLILGRVMTNTAQRTAEANAQRAEQHAQTLAQRTRELQQSETKFRTLAEMTAAAIFICQDKQIRYVNAAAELITGYTQSELVGLNPQTLLQQGFLDRFFNCAQEEQWALLIPLNLELQIVTKSGELRWLNITIGDMEFEGQPAILVTAFDITGRKQAEAALVAERTSLAQRVMERTTELSTANTELARAAQLKDEFLASMSHELRTPLNAILGMVESLQEGVYGPLVNTQRKPLRQIEESGRHLLALINDILDLSKIVAGKMQLDLRPVDVQAVCESSLQFIRQAAQKKRLQVSYIFDSGVKTLQADELRLKQILVNLLSNAVKFTPEGGTIGLDVQGDAMGQAVHLTVWDTGIGIAQSDLTRLFRPFVQLDSRLARQYEGTGLGLALVSQLTELHSGGVMVVSEEGRGSRFTVTLPWHPNGTATTQAELVAPHDPPAAVADDQHDDAVHAHRPATVVLAEDNQDNVITIANYLEAKGYRVVVACNGVEAVERAQEVQPDIILMDIQMPKMDGLEATRRIRAHTDLAVTPIIAVTALVMPGDRERCLEAGANAYLSKPVSLKHLVTLIEAHLPENRRSAD